MSSFDAVREHYDRHLAEHYDWMFGAPLEVMVAEQKAALRDAGVDAARGERALDLGCGSGFQSLALRELGYEVLAIDASEKLLDRLAGRASDRGIVTRLGDIRRLDELVDGGKFGVAVCMGDTLTHLSRREDVSGLFASVARALAPGGRLVLSYRDLARGELEGTARFILVRGDSERVMTCFLEYRDCDSVIVTDLIHVRDDRGSWELRKSCYTKLRLGAQWVRDQLVEAGLAIEVQRDGRMCTLVASKGRP